MTTETVFGQTLALWFGNGDEQHALELDTTGLNVKGNLYLYLTSKGQMQGRVIGRQVSHRLKGIR